MNKVKTTQEILGDTLTMKRVIAELNKTYGPNTMGTPSDIKTLEISRVPTGIARLDRDLGGGLPRGRMVELYGIPSCLDKDTFIPYAVVNKDGRVQNAKGGTIEHLYERFNGIVKRGKGYYQRPQTTTSSFVIPSVNSQNQVVRNKIIGVVDSGNKDCFKLTTTTNKIIASADHMFYVGNGEYKKLSELNAGDSVFAHNSLIPHRAKRDRKHYKEICVKYHPSDRKKTINNCLYYRIRESHATIEASLNNMDLKAYIALLNKAPKEQIDKITIIQKGYEVHHKDKNPSNNMLENLELLTSLEHYSRHKADRIEMIKYIVVPEKIASITPVGKRQTFDIQCEFPLNNYIANKIVVHNSGKSLISLLTIKSAQAMGLDCVYFDVENSYDPAWAKALGVNTNKLIIVNLEVAEDIFNAMVEVLKANPGVIVVDSIASMVTKAELEEPLEQVFMAPKARFLSKALGKINAHNQKTLIIFINQLRDNLTAMGAFGTKTPGGRALTHGMSIRLKIHRDSALLYKDGKKSGEVIGQILQWNIEKNKTCPPNKVGSVKYLYEPPRIEE